MQSNRGFTVAELCIALALTLIVATVAVTLCAATSGGLARIGASSELSAEINSIGGALDGWLLAVDDSSYTITALGYRLTATDGINTYYLEFDGGLTSFLPSGETVIQMHRIDNVCFVISDASLIECTVTYDGKTLRLVREIKSKR